MCAVMQTIGKIVRETARGAAKVAGIAKDPAIATAQVTAEAAKQASWNGAAGVVATSERIVRETKKNKGQSGSSFNSLKLPGVPPTT